MISVRADPRAHESFRAVWIALFLGACAIALGLVAAQTEMLAVVLFGGLLVSGAILHQPRRGIVVLSILVPLSTSARMPHQLLGVPGLNPLNLTLLATLGGLVLLAAFPGKRRSLPLKMLPLPAPLLALMILPMLLGAAHGSLSVDKIPAAYRRMQAVAFSDSGGYFRDVLVLPLLHVFVGLLMGLVLRVDGPGALSRKYLYLPLVGVSTLAVIFLINAFTSFGSVGAMADPTTRDALAAAAGMHPNEISLMFNGGLAWALFSARNAPLRGRFVLWSVAALLAIASVLTFSRGGFFGMLVVLIAYMLELRRMVSL